MCIISIPIGNTPTTPRDLHATELYMKMGSTSFTCITSLPDYLSGNHPLPVFDSNAVLPKMRISSVSPIPMLYGDKVANSTGTLWIGFISNPRFSSLIPQRRPTIWNRFSHINNGSRRNR
uniref:Uncharacterized protein n=1 Tax=Candidatus Kentrum sp. LFY TaxID=2126342 RepID=A0A450UJU4_9GAMM|nr:MAG: hypothetical protein BECKLFY1418A_GA0070994_102631 [Candidatus Kentron sp. LFY]